jgi:broad specificity phosphatase PhoE
MKYLKQFAFIEQLKINLIIIVLLMLGSVTISCAQSSDEMYTIYLVRHAEKEVSSENPKNPSLTTCGLQRSESIAEFLDKVDLDMVYSTNYKRTVHTAQPTATQKNLDISQYDPRELEAFATTLMELKQDALVVGHSNTTPVLAGLLIGEDIPPIDESIYNQIYQVVISKDTGQLQLFNSAFVCNE